MASFNTHEWDLIFLVWPHPSSTMNCSKICLISTKDFILVQNVTEELSFILLPLHGLVSVFQASMFCCLTATCYIRSRQKIRFSVLEELPDEK